MELATKLGGGGCLERCENQRFFLHRKTQLLPGRAKGELRTQNRGEGTGVQPPGHADTMAIATIRCPGDEGADGGK